MVRTCSHAHKIVSRLLYRDIKTKNHHARRLFVTILSNSKFSVHYPSFVVSLDYSAAIPSDAYLTFPLLSATLVALPNLRNLSLSIPFSMTEFLVRLLTRNGIIRQSSSPFKYIRPISEALYPVIPYNLSLLHSLCIDSHLSLLTIARCRPLKELTIQEPIDFSDLDFISSCLAGQSNTAEQLRSLTITVEIETVSEIAYSLLGLAAMFPSLEVLVFRTAHINALVRVFFFFLI